MLGGKVGKNGNSEKRFAEQYAVICCYFTSVQTEMNKDYAEMADRNWKNHEKRLEAQNKGRSSWYKHYRVRTAQLEREYEFEREKK